MIPGQVITHAREQFKLTAQQLSTGFQKLAETLERMDSLKAFRKAMRAAELAERRARIDARESRRQRHHAKAAAVKFLR